ncbi:MAG: YicC family protein [PVC group bacterium]|nr:YicC family protein [PVC group bacterium]
MIKSMTGFGRGKAAFGGGNFTVEFKTYNHKFFELSYKLPEQLQTYDDQVKKLIKKQIMRGKVYLWVNYERCSDDSLNLTVDEKRVRRYYNLLAEVKKKFKLKDDITLEQLLSFPEVIVCKPHKENQTVLWRAANIALKKALAALVLMRRKEGRFLYQDLNERAKNIEKALKKIEKYIPQVLHRYESKLKKRAKSAVDRNGGRGERVQTELAAFAKNCDVSEEMSRLSAHIKNFKTTLKTNKETGKVLDFIAQEAQREINTLGAKCSDFKISKEVIYIKGEIEKIREQVQNVE